MEAPSNPQPRTCEEPGRLLCYLLLLRTPESPFTAALTQSAKGNQTGSSLRPGTHTASLFLHILPYADFLSSWDGASQDGVMLGLVSSLHGTGPTWTKERRASPYCKQEVLKLFRSAD